jgi:hypothetical protein
MENGKNNFKGRFLFDWVDINWNATTVIGYAHAAINKKGNVYFGAISGQRLVNGVIDDFVDKVVEAPLTSGADVHSGAFADRLEALEDGDGASVIRFRDLFIRHLNPFKTD